MKRSILRQNCRIFLASVSVLFLAGCDHRNNQSSKFSGTLELTEHSVGAVTAGRIADLSVEEGDEVVKGQFIAALEHYGQAKRDFRRAAELLKSGGVSRQQYEHDRQAMEDQRVLSPIDGVVLLKVHEAGEVAAAGEPVVVLGDPQDMWIKIYVPESFVSRIKMNQMADIYVDGVKEKVFGHVIFIAFRTEFTPRNIQTPEERITQTFAVKVKVNNPSKALHPGVAADVYLR